MRNTSLGIVLLVGATHWKWALYSYARTMAMLLAAPWIDGVYWTLAIEIIFYSTVFLLLYGNLFKFIETYAAVLLGISSAYLLARIAFHISPISFLTLTQHGCFFSLGIAIWLIFAKGLTKTRLSLVAVAVVSGFCEITLTDYDNFPFAPAESFFWLPQIIWLTTIAFIFYCAAKPSLGNKVTRKIGLMTYPLYLLHNSVGCAALRTSHVVGKGAALSLALTLPIVFAWIVIEVEPLLRRSIAKWTDSAATILKSRPAIDPLFKPTASVA
jgi:peptidoglycan/LPS O-acetylase OafA/YrhL